MTAQSNMKAKLESLGLPYKEIQVYGTQIEITCHSLAAANKWASLLSTFASLKGVVESIQDAKENKNTVLLPTKVKVWRAFAQIKA